MNIVDASVRFKRVVSLTGWAGIYALVDGKQLRMVVHIAGMRRIVDIDAMLLRPRVLDEDILR